MISFKEFSIAEKEALVTFLTSQRWEYHSLPKIPEEKVNKRLQNGYFTGKGVKTFWVLDDGHKTGLIRLFDLGEEGDSKETPLFDIRIKKEFRGKGIGELAVKWLTDYVFTNYPEKNRFEATTRIDNVGMRRVFEKCGFVKEAHYRQAWPVENGKMIDCAGYAILKSDWENKTKTPVNFYD